MSTQSFLKNVNIKSKKQIRDFVKALEKTENFNKQNSKSALPSVKDAQDAKIENKMANELEPYVYKLITKDNQWN